MSDDMEQTKKFDIHGLNIVLRRVRVDDLKELHRLMLTVPWNKLLKDLTDCFSVRPDAFYAAFLEDKPSQMISHVAIAEWGNSHAYLAWFVTDAAYRGRGIGTQLMAWARSHVDNRLSIHLDADPGLDVLYERMGFHTISHNHRIKGIVALPAETVVASRSQRSLKFYSVSHDNFHLVKDYDKCIYPVDRSKYLKAFLVSQPERVTVMAIEDNKCVGYLCLRRTSTVVTTLCPLIAENQEIARNLLCHCISKFQLMGKTLDMLIPEANYSRARDVMETCGITDFVNAEAVMCTTPDQSQTIRIPHDKIYGTLFNALTMV